MSGLCDLGCDTGWAGLHCDNGMDVNQLTYPEYVKLVTIWLKTKPVKIE